MYFGFWLVNPLKVNKNKNSKRRSKCSAWRQNFGGSEKHGEDFAGPGGHSENLEAQMSFLRGSWRLCTFSLIVKANLKEISFYLFIIISIFSNVYFYDFKNLHIHLPLHTHE